MNHFIFVLKSMLAGGLAHVLLALILISPVAAVFLFLSYRYPPEYVIKFVEFLRGKNENHR